jgi:hypothetical protein
MAAPAEAKAATAEHRDGGPWPLRIVAMLLAAGMLARLLWLSRSPVNMTSLHGEAENVAASLATTGQFANAFGAELPTGPTAHVAPTTPLLTAAVYKLFGVDSATSLWLLSIIAVAVVLFGTYLFFRAFGRLGSPLGSRLLAVLIVALVPLQFATEVRMFRSWEGGLATLGIAAMLLWILKLDERDAITTRTLVWLGVANGGIALLNMSAGLATSGMIGILLMRRVTFLRWPIPVVASAVVIAMLVVPWAMRNERVLGAPVLLRTGLGISLATGYNDFMLGPDRGEAYDQSMHLYGPNSSAVARAEIRRVGEIAYNERLEKQARAWMAAHPDVTLRIRLENIRDFYFPPRYHFERLGAKARAVEVRIALIWAAAALGIAALLANLWQRRWRYLYVAVALLLPCLPYILTYPLLRYRYLVSTLLIFLACDGAGRLLLHLRARRGGAAISAPAAAGSGQS